MTGSRPARWPARRTRRATPPPLGRRGAAVADGHSGQADGLLSPSWRRGSGAAVAPIGQADQGHDATGDAQRTRTSARPPYAHRHDSRRPRRGRPQTRRDRRRRHGHPRPARRAQRPDAGDVARAARDRQALPDDVRVVVVRGSGHSFSAGLDRALLDPAGIAGEESVAGLLELDDAGDHRRRSTATSRASPGCATRGSSSIAAVQGYAIGAGFQLALACDLRVVADDAKFCMKEPALGLVPDLTGTKPLVESCWLRPSTGDLRHRADGRGRRGRGHRAGAHRRTGRPSWTPPSPTWSAALTAPLAGAVRETKALLQARRPTGPGGAAAAGARGAGPPVPRACSLMRPDTGPSTEGGTRCQEMHGSRPGAAWRHLRSRPQRRQQPVDRGTVRRVVGFARPHRGLIAVFLGPHRRRRRAWSWSSRCWSSTSSTTASSRATAAW